MTAAARGMRMGELASYRLRKLLTVSFASALVSGVTTPFFFGFKLIPLVNGAIIGFFSALLILALRDFVLDPAASRWSVGRSFLVGFGSYSVVIVGVAVVSFKATGADKIFSPLRLYPYSLGFGMTFSLLANAVLVVSDIVGRQELAELLLGRYHRPASEHRVFLFMDLMGSTALAERLGNARYLEFLNEAYADLSEAIILTRAQIYKYVGDEIILTWKAAPGDASSAVRFFRAAQESLKSRGTAYLSRYGIVPRFRAGCHKGDVVTGQLGLLKKEITFIGDVMNTASRIMDEAKRLGYELVLSEAVYEELDSVNAREGVPLGETALRGKSRAVRLFGFYPRENLMETRESSSRDYEE